MKNYFIAFVVVLSSCFAGINRTDAQTGTGSTEPGLPANNSETRTIYQGIDFVKGPGKVNGKALIAFQRRYSNAERVRWNDIKEGSYVTFTLNGIEHKVFYNQRGKWAGSIKSYGEEKLPLYVRGIVKSKYYDYSIFYVQEIEAEESNGIPTYLVHIEDGHNFKQIRICNGEMEIWRELINIEH
jgi:hypothetical protein